eukprot:CAMPEP_0172723012 /NCGR_PEP_ID=MMETSP1074-20121228/82785_1 /TAXON_ID=2916 /ORGANISM="Ceratium fusus, Strain PA161109" /LENGTH=251 /DNA_ID=CAMNT_0013549159 /DNA_START=58 /DNA_END=811 /DNA_ORIENTATION=+
MPIVIIDERYRLRSNTYLEALRVCLQCVLLVIPFTILAAFVSELFYGERFWVLPFRLYEDAFGPLEDLRALKAPLLDRRRFEQPGNLWRRFVFPVDTIIGHLQVRCFQLFNGISGMAWEGHIALRIFIWSGGFFIVNQIAMLLQNLLFKHISFWSYKFRTVWPITYGRVLKMYVGTLPEQCLILEQLAFAHEAFGRELSPAVEAEVKRETAARRKQDEAETRPQQELEATVYGNQTQTTAPISENMPMNDP